jgi:biopolymer transport protein ExbB/TolQ
MPLFGLMGTVLGLIAMFDSLGSSATVEAIAPQLALALKCTLYGALFSSLYKISATRFEQRLKGLDYDFDTLCRALKVIFDNQAHVEVAR